MPGSCRIVRETGTRHLWFAVWAGPVLAAGILKRGRRVASCRCGLRGVRASFLGWLKGGVHVPASGGGLLTDHGRAETRDGKLRTSPHRRRRRRDETPEARHRVPVRPGRHGHPTLATPTQSATPPPRKPNHPPAHEKKISLPPFYSAIAVVQYSDSLVVHVRITNRRNAT
jgi:hypothetical protein